MNRFEKAAASLEILCRTMAQLRAPGGCPWDAEQTFESLKPYLIEETYETIDAMDSGDPTAHRDELGDLLLQIVFQAEIAQESGLFDMASVSDAIESKLQRRHPHVFGEARADDSQGALRNWEEIKSQERGRDSSCLDGIPKAMPALLRALRTGEKAGAVGFDWPDIEGVWRKLDEECEELREIPAASTAASAAAAATLQQRRSEEIGDLLFTVANLSRHLGIDPEAALHAAVNKFHHRFRIVESAAAAQRKLPKDLDLEALEALWQQAKREELRDRGLGKIAETE